MAVEHWGTPLTTLLMLLLYSPKVCGQMRTVMD